MNHMSTHESERSRLQYKARFPRLSWLQRKREEFESDLDFTLDMSDKDAPVVWPASKARVQ